MLKSADFRGLDERLIVDTSEDQPVHLLASKNGRYIRLSASAYQLLQLHDAGVSFETIAEQLRETGQDVSTEDVEAAYQHVANQVAQIEANERPQPGFLIRLSLLPEKLVASVASRLSIAFHPIVVAFLLAWVVVSHAPVLMQSAPLDLAPKNFWLGYALLLLSTLMHEFGHASACARYGISPSSIGFTIYLIYPTFYSDVSAAWELKRWQRVVVDLGGAFFQLVVGAGFATGYLFSGWEPFRVALLMILGNLVFSMNPIFKFDGYWVVADALGVTNLGQQPRRIFNHFLARLRAQPTKPLPWPTPVKIALLPYTLLTFGFWGIFVWRVIPMIWQQIGAYPDLVSGLISDLLDPAQAVHFGHFQPLITSTYMIVIVLLLVWRLSAPLFSIAKAKMIKPTQAGGR
ncbi:MAG TPA: hypothetical protein ENN19_13775 [Chloroflexi bacterium]|nr:hypothetical protein [Chloroflexota bacterium]